MFLTLFESNDFLSKSFFFTFSLTTNTTQHTEYSLTRECFDTDNNSRCNLCKNYNPLNINSQCRRCATIYNVVEHQCTSGAIFTTITSHHEKLETARLKIQLFHFGKILAKKRIFVTQPPPHTHLVLYFLFGIIQY